MMAAALASWLVSCVVYGAILRQFFRTQALTAFSATFFLAILLHVRPVLFLLGLDIPLQEDGFDTYFLSSALASLVGVVWIILVTVTFILFRRPMAAVGGALLPQAPISPPARIMAVYAILATAVSLASTLYLVEQEGSIAGFMYAVKIGKELTGSYWVRQISVLAAIISLYGLLANARRAAPGSRARRVDRRLGARTAAFYGALIAMNLTANYLWGNRMNLALFLFAAGLGIHVFIRSFRPRELVVGLALAAVSLGGLRLLRNSLVHEVTGQENERILDVRAVSMSLHFAQFDGLMLALRDAGHQFEFRYGEDFYNGLVSWVPRSVMPERETFQVGSWFRRVYQPSRVNGWPVTVIGDWYINFGWFGILIGAVISGALMAAINGAYRHVREHPWHAVMAPTLGFFLLDGGVDPGFPQGIFGLILPLGLLAFAARQASLASPSRRPGRYAGRFAQDGLTSVNVGKQSVRDWGWTES